MRADRRTAEEQYQLVLACRYSGLTDAGWCREHGINPDTFSTWIRRLKKRGGFHIPQASKQPPCGKAAHDIVRLDVLTEEGPGGPDGDRDNPTPLPIPQAEPASIEIEAGGAVFRFSSPVDPSLYEKTLLLIGGQLL